MEVYKLGKKAYVAIPMKSCTAEKAISKANEHFKIKRELLECHEGFKSRGALWVNGSIGILKNNVWVVSRRKK